MQHRHRRFIGLFAVGAFLTLITAGAFANPVVVRIGDGIYPQPSDSEAVGVQPAAGGGYAVSATEIGVRFPARSGDAIAVQAPGYEALNLSTVGLVTADAAGVVVDRAAFAAVPAEGFGNVVRYASTLAGVDDEFSVFETRLKHEVVLHHRWPLAAGGAWLGYEALVDVPRGYDFTTGTGEAIEGLVSTLQVIAPDGQAMYRLPAPVARDARGQEVTGRFAVEPAGGDTTAWRVRVLMPGGWLATAAYPVRLDPTIQIPAGTGGNAIPFRWVHDGTWPSSTYQQTYSAAQMTMGGMITHVGVRFNSTVNRTFDRIAIYLGETTFNHGQYSGTFANNFNVSGPTLVYDDDITYDAPAGGYSSVALTTPFVYSGNNNLLVEYRVYNGATGTGMATVSAGGHTVENWRNYSNNVASTSASGSDNYLIGAEFTILTFSYVNPANGVMDDSYEGDAVSVQLEVSGGAAPYSFQATGLPTGITVSTSGLLTGTLPSGSAGNYSIDLDITDSQNVNAVLGLDWDIYELPTLSGTLPTAVEGFAYNHGLTTTGGKDPYAWQLLHSVPPLPTGLSLNSTTGGIVGTPPTGSAGTYDVYIEVVDDNGRRDDTSVLLTINPRHSIVTNSLPEATDTGSYGPVPIEAIDGLGPFTYTASGLPSGLTIHATSGTISGTVAGNQSVNSPFTVSIVVRDSNNATETVPLPLIVNPVPRIGDEPMPPVTIGAPYDQPVPVTGGTLPLAWAAEGLPEGLIMGEESGEIEGAASHSMPAGPYAVLITVTDANGVSDTVEIELTLERRIHKTSGCAAPHGGPNLLLIALLALGAALAVARRRHVGTSAE